MLSTPLHFFYYSNIEPLFISNLNTKCANINNNKSFKNGPNKKLYIKKLLYSKTEKDLEKDKTKIEQWFVNQNLMQMSETVPKIVQWCY